MTTEHLKIKLSGCDDSTTVEHAWTKEQAETLIEFAQMVNANVSYGCEVEAEVWHNGVYTVAGWDASGNES